MTPIEINRFKAQLRIPSGAPGGQARIERIMADGLDHLLEGAVERAGLPSRGHLCIRDLRAAVRLRLREPDSVLAARLAEAIAGAIIGAFKNESNAGVYYASRVQALIDLAAGVLRGDFARSWAWSQLGMWRSGAMPRGNAAVELVMRVIASEPQHAVAAVAYLARARFAFAAMLERGTPEAWAELARAATRACGSSIDTIEPSETEYPRASVDRIAARVVGQSAIARAAANAIARDLPSVTVRALAALAILEVEPAVVRNGGDPARAMVTAVDRALETARITHRSAIPSREVRDHNEVAEQQDGVGRDWRAEERTADQAPGEQAAIAEGRHRGVLQSTEASPRKQQGSNDPVAERPLPEVRRRAATRAGGLLYLINVAERIGLPERILSDHRLTERGLRWTLHQLAGALLALEQADPAALAFAGLLPDARPPSAQQMQPIEAELEATREYRAALLEGLRDALRARNYGRDETDEALIDFVCRRPADIAADPGWIEVHFALADVATEIRAAGLDLDPGWVPWLGVVVRFVYA